MIKELLYTYPERCMLFLDQAKLEALEAIRKAIKTWNHNKKYNWQLMAISSETANKLLQGMFKTLLILNIIPSI